MQKTLGVIGWSGSGKTTLIASVLPLLRARGLRVAVIKHCHHPLEFDQPGKDSHRLRQAGATEVMVLSPTGWAVFADVDREPTLAEQLSHLSEVDLVLLEGQKRLALPKLEVYRSSVGKPPRYPDDPDIIAVACDQTLAADRPVLDLNDAEAVADFVAAWARAKN
ncbi:MAG: molybdopterin-guanine dinucleotide biosynthesis protein B [Paludibacterium sp.]|uniref:molybdopterin-guanine dinucleotide biosynthesis protein B n=1 Tax=Paludibacterium sp. TaxID=1917523 RepID=UPI0025E8C8E7|nr:molybdopterin-guanine dinucleotide biosynthesis protein B [Paludibacterium sp.]MBV8047059.1 molybdopterin-guanine dinucleotide biosynthesis protein B [Paludibacterium sp.]MBV8646417.1 molybdopterin-guanine dinucleotide biosynthesis protein B [Paludibacterium sp.]